jgi:hypothetical protein
MAVAESVKSYKTLLGQLVAAHEKATARLATTEANRAEVITAQDQLVATTASGVDRAVVAHNARGETGTGRWGARGRRGRGQAAGEDHPAMSALKPTPEQQAAIDAFTTGGTVVIHAGAGTAKMSTLRLLSANRPKAKGLYVAYNKAIQSEAEQSFPRNVESSDAHSLPYRTFGAPMHARLDGPRVTARASVGTQGDREVFGSPPPTHCRGGRSGPTFRTVRICGDETNVAKTLIRSHPISPGHLVSSPGTGTAFLENTR